MEATLFKFLFKFIREAYNNDTVRFSGLFCVLVTISFILPKNWDVTVMTLSLFGLSMMMVATAIGEHVQGNQWLAVGYALTAVIAAVAMITLPYVYLDLT